MRSAPAVTVRCAGGPGWRLLLWLLPTLAVAAVAYWLTQQAGLATVVSLAVAVLGGIAAGIVASRHAMPTPQLCWDGALWTSDGQPVHPQVMMDGGGSWMLLRLHAQPWPGAEQAHSAVPRMRRVWVAVSERNCSADWHAWRAAVYCPPPDPTALGGVRQSP